ncbi:SGNH/GDSL hydrolase family protein [Nocardioides sp. URHA0020]|uniref:SGNH/GDSL hydrolase family protein n=1 Tax=Nocardioides sp. URHA0020 TaxID=1380392 RepID=UPI00048DF5BE|nr:SGNH/GDSL hydrolase family protein [Nocardioides sp. URHA0020]
MNWSVRRPWWVAAFVVVMVAALSVTLGVRAQSADASRCQRFAADSLARAASPSGPGRRVVVIGDSWSAGLGLTRPARSWPSQLPGSVHVAGFSGSGFSVHASHCDRVDFARRAPDAVRGGADLVVVEGGLNDYDQPDSSIRAGFARLMQQLQGYRVVVVGPATAPARARAVPHVDAILSSLSRQYDVPYVDTSGLDLTYLADDLHLTRAGHVEFGRYVADRLAALGGLEARR